MMSNIKKHGIIIVEVLVVMILLGGLTAMLLPDLKTYVDKTRFSDVVRAANALKPSVSLCIYKKRSVSSECDGGAEGIPANVAANYGGHVASVNVADGVITATSTSDLDSKTFVLTPTLTTNNEIIWTSSGTCSENGLCANNATTDESSTTDTGTTDTGTTDTGTTDTGTTDTGTTDTGTTDTGITYTPEQQLTLDNCSSGHSGLYCSYVNASFGCYCSSAPDCSQVVKSSITYRNPAGCILIP